METPITFDWIRDRIARMRQQNPPGGAIFTSPLPADCLSKLPGPREEAFVVALHTARHVYNITAKPSYLGCVVHDLEGSVASNQRDLTNGKLTRKTWLAIFEDIVTNELQL